MARFRFYHIPLLSWHSEALYQDVVTSWTGLNGVYLFLFLLVCISPLLFSDHDTLRASVDVWLTRARFIPVSDVISVLVLRCLFALLFLFLYALLLLIALFFAVAGIIVCSLLDTELSLSALFRISVVALTPAMIVLSILRGMAISIPFLPAILVAMTSGYVVFGIAVNRGKQGRRGRLPRSEW